MTHNKASTDDRADVKKQKTIMIIQSEPLWLSIKRDIFTFFTVLVMAGVGRVIGSTLMEYVGGLLLLLVVATKLARLGENQKYTYEEAKVALENWAKEEGVK